jgi:hypothetical protein
MMARGENPEKIGNKVRRAITDWERDYKDAHMAALHLKDLLRTTMVHIVPCKLTEQKTINY